MKKTAKFLSASSTFNTIDKVFTLFEDYDFKNLDKLVTSYQNTESRLIKTKLTEKKDTISQLNKWKDYKVLKLNRKQKDIIESAYSIINE